MEGAVSSSRNLVLGTGAPRHLIFALRVWCLRECGVVCVRVGLLCGCFWTLVVLELFYINRRLHDPRLFSQSPSLSDP